MLTKINRILLGQILIRFAISNKPKKHTKGSTNSLKTRKSQIKYQDSQAVKHSDQIPSPKANDFVVSPEALPLKTSPRIVLTTN